MTISFDQNGNYFVNPEFQSYGYLKKSPAMNFSKLLSGSVSDEPASEQEEDVFDGWSSFDSAEKPSDNLHEGLNAVEDLHVKIQDAILINKCKNLRHLQVSGDLSDEENRLKVITQLASLKFLKTLILDNTWIGPKGVSALVKLKNLKSLNALSLSACSLGPDDMALIAQADNFPNLKKLDVSSNYIQDKGFKALLKLPLVDLNVESCDLNDIAIYYLAKSENTKKLTHLNLESNDFGYKGVEDLAHSPYVKNIEALYLGFNDIGEKGAEALSKSSCFHNLEQLNIGYNSIGERGAKALLSSSNLRKLSDYSLENWVK